MASILDPDLVKQFLEKTLKIQSRLQDRTAQLTGAMVEKGRAHKQLLSSTVDTCSKKFKDDEEVIKVFPKYEKHLAKKMVLMKEKRDAVSQSLGELEQKQSQVDELRLKIQKLREEQAGRRDRLGQNNSRINVKF
ncbi:hypothetical protein CRUP_028147 [Coryphaenoides rupestris]|nr:hypothetical protein CRUP_028147 [Coryphaenoides rupestris]